MVRVHGVHLLPAERHTLRKPSIQLLFVHFHPAGLKTKQLQVPIWLLLQSPAISPCLADMGSSAQRCSLIEVWRTPATLCKPGVCGPHDDTSYYVLLLNMHLALCTVQLTISKVHQPFCIICMGAWSKLEEQRVL